MPSVDGDAGVTAAPAGADRLRAAMADGRWDDWRWHMAHRIQTVDGLRRWLDVTDAEARAIAATRPRYRWSVTPYYASLMDPTEPSCPIRRQAIPADIELSDAWDDVDPVGDRDNRRTNRVVHKYPDRVVLLVTRVCPVYCRHCTRKHHTSERSGSYFGNGETRDFDEDFDYIAGHPEIRDVLLTGGDPLSYPDHQLEPILARLRAIPHVEIIRIGSRFPVLLPQRITPALCALLERHHPLWLNTHFNHPREVTPEAAGAVDRLLRHGVPVQNQSVLLRGINDDLATMRALLTRLLAVRVRPYYLYHCDSVRGVGHFATTIEDGLRLMEDLTGRLTGFGVPAYVLTTRIGKITLNSHRTERTARGWRLTGWDGRTVDVDSHGRELTP
jgi:lysine 2,3-aminomutase